MKHFATSSTILAIATIAGAIAIMPAAADAATRTRLECRANGAADISMAARHEVGSARTKFTTEFEAGPGTGFAAGSTLAVQVKGVTVGTMRLDPVLGGDVVGDLNFDTRPQPSDSIAFPANWPAPISRGADVKLLRGIAVVLGCRLR